MYYIIYIHLTKTTAAQNEVALSYHRVRGLYYYMAVVFAVSIVSTGIFTCRCSGYDAHCCIIQLRCLLCMSKREIIIR